MNIKNNNSTGGGFKLFFAKQYSKFFKNPQYIGVTGAYGKTTTALASERVLAQKYLSYSPKTEINNLSELVSVIFKIPVKSQKIILDLLLENETDVDGYSKLVHFSALIVTSLEEITNDALKSNQKALQQVKLIEKLAEKDSLIINYEDSHLRKLIESKNVQPIFYGLDEKKCHVWASNIKIHNFQTVFELNYGVERVEVKTKFLGEHQIYPLLAATALGIDQGVSLGSIKKALESLEPLKHHFEPLLGFNDCIIIDDTYHDLEITAIEAIETINLLPARRRVVVLNDNISYEQSNLAGLKEIARQIYKDRVDLVFLGGGRTQIIADELLSLGFIPERLEAGLQNTQITSQLLKVLSKGDVVLIKGSKTSKLSEVVKKITKVK